jgi:predicted lipoprotein with Yx(FWY)xxD motif
MKGTVPLLGRRGLIAAAAIIVVAAGLPAVFGARPAARAQAGTTVMVMQNANVGAYLTDPNGKTLYVFSADAPDTSNCNANCATPWPPFPAPAGNLTAPAGVTGALATITRQDGSQHVTYNHQPLYYFARDANPGDVNGQGVTAFGGTWSAATP